MKLFLNVTATLAALMSAATAHDPATGRATAILNEGVIVEQGGVKILFDPVYDNGFNAFPEMSEDLKADIVNGAPPYDGVDAIFISHFHEDHFSAPNMVKLLAAQGSVQLYAPVEAVDALRSQGGWDEKFADRVIAVSLENDSMSISYGIKGVMVEAVRTPHIGWPDSHANVQNITFRVTLPGGARVMHMGDADADPAHFKSHAAFFRKARTHMGFVPFWFINPDGMTFMDAELNIAHPIGIHVPIEIPESLKAAREELNAGFFSELGESRIIKISDEGTIK